MFSRNISYSVESSFFGSEAKYIQSETMSWIQNAGSSAILGPQVAGTMFTKRLFGSFHRQCSFVKKRLFRATCWISGDVYPLASTKIAGWNISILDRKYIIFIPGPRIFELPLWVLIRECSHPICLIFAKLAQLDNWQLMSIYFFSARGPISKGKASLISIIIFGGAMLNLEGVSYLKLQLWLVET